MVEKQVRGVVVKMRTEILKQERVLDNLQFVFINSNNEIANLDKFGGI